MTNPSMGGGGQPKMTSGLRQGGCAPSPDRQVTLQHPRVIPPEQPFMPPAFAEKKIYFCPINHLKTIRFVAPSAVSSWRGHWEGALVPLGDTGHRACTAPARLLPLHRSPLPTACKARRFASPGQENPLAYSHGANNENTNYISLTYQRDDSWR